MKSLTAFAFIIIGLALTGNRGVADTESFSGTFTQVELGTGPADVIALNGFDPSLGTLASVTLTLNLTTTSDFTVYNNNSVSVLLNYAQATYSTVLTGPDSSTVSYEAQPVWIYGQDMAANSSIDLGTKTESFDGSTSVPTPNLSQYVSGSTLNFSLALPSSLAGGGVEVENGDDLPGLDSLMNGDYPSSSSGTVTVTYTYLANAEDAVPEPSTWALLLGGVGLLVVWRRRSASARKLA